MLSRLHHFLSMSVLPLKRFDQWRGRASRSEICSYAVLFATAFAIAIGLSLMSGATWIRTGPYGFNLTFSEDMGIWMRMFVVVPALAIGALWLVFILTLIRRLHDIGLSGWWLLGLFLLSGLKVTLEGSGIEVTNWIAQSIIILVMLWPGDLDENRFGPSPGQSLTKNEPETGVT